MPDTELAPELSASVSQILALEDDDALEEALAAAGSIVAAHAVSAAPDLERKTELLWAMEDRQRREVLDTIPPALVGALVQNLEEDNRYLLGDVSFEQFRAVLALCSPERRYYWVTTALSFTDARANVLPLLLPTSELVSILMTRSEFHEHLSALAEYPLEHQRLPPEVLAEPAQGLVDLFGAENLLREFPIKDTVLALFLQTVLDYDPDRYVDLIRGGLRMRDYHENHPLEHDTLVEDPVLLQEIGRPEPLGEDEWDPLEELEQTEEPAPPLSLVPVGAPPLVLLAASLPAQQRERLAGELQQAYIRQAIAEGGSFLLSDLRRVARSVEAYLLLGLRAESGGVPDREASVLVRRSLPKVLQSGARVVETLRQVALRLQPLTRVMDPRARALIESLVRPRLTVGPAGDPRVQLLPADGLPEEATIEDAAALLQRVAGWADLARALGLDRTETALQNARTVARLEEELAIGGVLFSRLEPGLTEAPDRRRFAARYLSPDGDLLPEAVEGLRKTVEAWGAARSLEPSGVVEALTQALRRIKAE